jgi:hypothetical protein
MTTLIKVCVPSTNNTMSIHQQDKKFEGKVVGRHEFVHAKH